MPDARPRANPRLSHWDGLCRERHEAPADRNLRELSAETGTSGLDVGQTTGILPPKHTGGDSQMRRRTLLVAMLAGAALAMATPVSSRVGEAQAENAIADSNEFTIDVSDWDFAMHPEELDWCIQGDD